MEKFGKKYLEIGKALSFGRFRRYRRHRHHPPPTSHHQHHQHHHYHHQHHYPHSHLHPHPHPHLHPHPHPHLHPPHLVTCGIPGMYEKSFFLVLRNGNPLVGSGTSWEGGTGEVGDGKDGKRNKWKR